MLGLVALVTGAASGLGKATAIALLRKGVRVVTIDTECMNDECMEEFSHYGNSSFIAVEGDVQSTHDVSSAIDVATSNWGQLDIAVNCAGLAINRLCYNRKRDLCHNFDDFKAILNTNVKGTFNVIRHAARTMAANEIISKNERGVIINTSSIDAYDGTFGNCASSASAGAITSMTLPIARDLSSIGIRVNTIAPGYFKTSALTGRTDTAQEFLCDLTVFPHRLGELVEFCDCVMSIIENKMINGEVIRIDAGFSLPIPVPIN